MRGRVAGEGIKNDASDVGSDEHPRLVPTLTPKTDKPDREESPLFLRESNYADMSRNPTSG